MLRAALVLVAIAASASAQEGGSPARSARPAEVRRTSVIHAAPGWTGAVLIDARLAPRPEVLRAADGGARDASALDAPGRDPGAPAPCLVDWCQPAVEVPGLERAHARISRSELVAVALDGAGLGPLADLVWVLVGTGVEVDWRPAQLETSGGAPGSGRGSVTLWLKLRVDALGRPSFPARERAR
jgi:hypothetical protein